MRGGQGGARRPAGDVGQDGVEDGGDGVAVLLLEIHDAVGTGVEGVRGDDLAGGGVDALHGPDGGPTRVVQVEYRRGGV